jgi:2,3-bisphosphoglycerate-independent phosphoglycerate mutase
LITADHGNVEQMLDPETGQPLTSHTNGPVPLVYVGSTGLDFISEGSLCDLAPTLLSLINVPIPAEMTGKVLLGETGTASQAASQ